MSILLVDDSVAQRMALASILKTVGYSQTLMAQSAAEALQHLNDDAAGIDLILMDLDMPGVDGIAACRQLKAYPQLQDIPIIMVTASTAVSDLQAAFDAGAIDYITKPPHTIELRARVGSALRLKQEMDRRKAREQELLAVTQQLVAANSRLERLSSLDGLTGVANRRQFDITLDREWKRGFRHETPLGLILLDIDYFKLYNDTYGHQGGDECLKRVAALLAENVQRGDDLVARYGGEEFATILPNTNRAGVATIAERLCASVAALGIPHRASQVSVHVTISVGAAAVVPSRAISAADLIAAADQALYQAKQAGRNQVKVAEIGE
jgi:diguanylate cyclase (GGDEF)-like protein